MNRGRPELQEFSMGVLLAFLVICFWPIQAFSAPPGKTIYDRWCAQCHGYKGDGKGYAADFVFPKPRDFTRGTYKFKSTPSGDPPTDADIIRSIVNGNPGTSMPSWWRFSSEELIGLVDYLKSFSPDSFTVKTTPIKIGTPPGGENQLVQQGKKLYETTKCWECHGKEGRGDGQKGWQEKFKDDWGNRAVPTDQTSPWEYRNGFDVQDIFRTITVGIDGTPMTSYGDTVPEQQRWALAYYVKSSQLKRKLGIALRAKKVKTILSSSDDPLWGGIDYLDIPMGGQMIFEPRDFTAPLSNVRVRGVYTESEIAILLEWDDKKPNRGDDGLPPDAARLQFPSKISSGPEKPYFFMGDQKRTVNIWQWTASDNLGAELNCQGPGRLTRQEKQEMKSTGVYKDGSYRVVFLRLLKTQVPDDPVFELGKFIPLAVTLYDGRNKEGNLQGAVSGWYYLMLEPPYPLQAYILPPLAFFVLLGIGFALRKELRKKK